jgi:DNA-directed RNA polymerase specialized sigma24 family protein
MKYTYGVNAQGFNEELMNCVEKVLSDIDPAWATYFVQIVYDNLPLQDIAKEVHLSMATVKRKIDDITKLIQVKCQDCI